MKKFYSISIIILFFNVLLLGQSRIYAPNLRSPLNRTVNVGPNVTLDWDAVTGQSTNITYEVQLATLPDFSDAITFPKTDLTALQMTELIFGHKYYWRVKAYDDQEPSDWSEIWSFTVLNSVNITDPKKLDDEVFTTTSISWVPITGLTKYQLQVDTSYDWKIQTGITEADINGSYAFDMNNVWLVGNEGAILHYDGNVWTLMDAGITEDLKSITFIDPMNGYAVGTGGTVLNYNGTDWISVDVGTSENLNAVSFSDSNNGWIVGDNGALIHFHNGSWTVETPSDIVNATGVYTLSASSAWICGNGKMVAHWDGTAWTSEVVGSRDHNAIWFTDENNGWVVSKSGKIAHFNGQEWVDQSLSGVSDDLNSICFSGTSGYIAGNSGTMLNYVGKWQLMYTGTDQDLKTVCVNADAGIVGGVGGEIIAKSMEGFNSPYLRTYNVNSDSSDFEIENLLFGKRIFFRMRAMHAKDTTYWTEGRSVITQAAPELDKPNNNVTDADLQITYKWKAYTGASEFTFQISPFADFSDGFITSSDSLSTVYIAKFFGREYNWRVNAINSKDTSDWSETRKLTTASSVILVSPDDGETDVAFCPNYEWEEIIGVVSYEIWIDKNPNFSQPMKGISNIPSFQCSTPLDRNTKYYWKVRASTNADTSEWSAVSSFTVQGYAGIEDVFSSDYVDIYPNPAKDNVTLTINSFINEIYGVNIYDITGKVIYTNQMECRSGENDFSINLTGLQKGLYIVTITKQDKTVSKKLFID